MKGRLWNLFISFHSDTDATARVPPELRNGGPCAVVGVNEHGSSIST